LGKLFFIFLFSNPFSYNSFWNFGSVAVQELLTKSDLQLDELLEEEGLILEVKSQNQNLYEL